MKRALSFVASIAVPLALCSCKAPAPQPPQQFSFRITSDPDKPLAGAQLKVSGKLLAMSDDSGVAAFSMSGNDGETFDVAVQCPTGYQSPVQPATVTLRRLASSDKTAEYHVACPPTTRSVVIAVNGEKGRRIPILQLGQEIARTDSSGVATVLLHPGPQDQFDLTLDTRGAENADLRPQSPTATFTVKNRDEVFVFEPHFSQARRKPVYVAHAAAPKGPPMPIRIQ